MDTETLAQRFSCRVDHIRALVARREIPHGRIGRLIRFNIAEVERWIVEAANRDHIEAAVLS